MIMSSNSGVTPESGPSQPDFSRFEHILEIYDFSSDLKTQDIVTSLSVFNSRDFDIKWVDPTHALVVFSSRTAAQEALNMPYHNLKLRPLTEAINESQTKVLQSGEHLLPYKQRPQTSTVLARRLVSGALGLRTNITPEQRAAEKKKLDEARERRRSAIKHTQDIWEGNVSIPTKDLAKANLTSIAGMKWLDILEKEFDKAFVDLDVIISHFDEDQNELHFFDARQRMGDIASIFCQLVHKASLIFESNSKLEHEFLKLKNKFIEAEAEKKVLQRQLEAKLAQLNVIAETYHSKRKQDPRIAPLSVANPASVSANDESSFTLAHVQQEIKHLRKENINLRKQMLNLESELLGARLKSRYLDKELSGRIQQIQLLSKPDLKSQDQDRVWNQLEAEIHLHRHKTVVRACRDRMSSCSNLSKEVPVGHDYELLKKRQGVGEIREVTIDRKPEEGLGISITGGKEHGIPVLISQIHPNTPASRCGCLYVGDAVISVNDIDLRDLKHEEAAEVLSKQKGTFVLQVYFVSPDDDSEDDGQFTQCPFLDPDIISQMDESVHEDKSEWQEQGSLDSEADALSSVTDTYAPSSNKFYPGVAQLCTEGITSETPRVPSSALRSYASCATNSKKETLID